MATSEVMATFFALLLTGGIIGMVGLWFAPARYPQFAQLKQATLPLMAFVAAGATAGSLYFSEVAGFIPCELCWLQRVAMYPMAILLPMAAARRDWALLPYVLALSTAGLLVSAYHVQLQWFPDQGSFCEAVNPCTGRWVEGLGFMTIPQMAGLSFVILTGLSTLSLIHPPQEAP